MKGVPANLRKVNERAVFDRLLRHGPASRAELAKSIRISAPTVGKVVDGLLEAGLLEEADTLPMVQTEDAFTAMHEVDARLGRPGRTLRLNRDKAGIVAVQLGVHHTRVAALPVAGPMGEDWPIEFETSQNPGEWSRALRKAARSLASAQPWAVMVSVPGVVDEKQKKVLLAPNLHWLELADLPGLLRDVWGCGVELVQEIRALALGHLSAQPQERDFLLVDIGAGVGGAAVLNGQLFTSSLPLSGELGHTPVVGNRRKCGCGATGCVETMTSRPGLLASMPRRQRGAASWSDLIKRIETQGVEPWLAEAMDGLGVVVGGAMNVLGVRQVVFTGAVTELPGEVMNELSKAVQRSAMWARFGEVQCVAAPRRWAQGLVAAAIDRVLLPMPSQGDIVMSDTTAPKVATRGYAIQ